jgi:hypothetical protein
MWYSAVATFILLDLGAMQRYDRRRTVLTKGFGHPLLVLLRALAAHKDFLTLSKDANRDILS